MALRMIEAAQFAARDFERAIDNSACSPEEGRANLTLVAVEQLVDRLKRIDSEIGSDTELGRELRVAFRSELQKLCAMGPLWNRGLTKPRGYPGDFETLHSLYRNLPIAADPIGRELDRAFLESPLARTVRGRKKLLVTYLRQVVSDCAKDPCRLLDLACGPSVDVAEVLCGSERDGSIHFVCVDQDADAIAYAQSLLGNTKNKCVVDFLKANVLRVRPCADTLLREPFHVVYSVGLLDYVPDNLSSIALRNWWRMLAPGGRLVLTMKDRDRYDPTFYDWLADWTFIPRTKRNFLRLLKESLGLSECEIELLREETGVSVMAIMHKQ